MRLNFSICAELSIFIIYISTSIMYDSEMNYYTSKSIYFEEVKNQSNLFTYASEVDFFLLICRLMYASRTLPTFMYLNTHIYEENIYYKFLFIIIQLNRNVIGCSKDSFSYIQSVFNKYSLLSSLKYMHKVMFFKDVCNYDCISFDNLSMQNLN